MRKTSKEDSGFTAVEAILALVIIALLGTVGWLVFKQHSNKQTAGLVTSTTASPATSSANSKYPPSTSSAAQGVKKEQPAPSTRSLYPADAATPAAGACTSENGPQVTIAAYPDVPSPQCVQVSASQSLTVANDTTQAITVKFAGYQFSIEPQKSHNISATFGSYLQPGVHDLTFGSLYAGSSAEIWLK